MTTPASRPDAATPWRARLAGHLQTAWQHDGLLARMLAPLGWLAQRVSDRRRERYVCKPHLAWRAPVPVLVIGNLLVGGTGKTPLLVATVQALQARGWHPGVVSRGYGVTVGAVPRVGLGTPAAAEIGDEPALIAAATGVPVAVHPDRPAAARALLAAHPAVDVIVSDDGLQHRALGRDVELLVEDERGVGNGRVLPAGPLREAVHVRDSVDAIVCNGDPAKAPAARTRLIGMHVTSTGARHLASGAQLSLPALAQAHAPVAAVAGIGRPERFFAALRAAGVPLAQTRALPDHADFSRLDFDDLAARAILLTEKDAVKCAHLPDRRLWAVTASIALSDPHFFDWLHQRLTACRPSLSPDLPPHGHSTA